MPWRTAALARDLYTPWLIDILENGKEVDVRGRKTVELLNCVSEVTEPWHHCILIKERHWNPWLAMSEALWILAGRNDIKPLQKYNSHIADYSDDGVTTYGAYGPRIYDQIDPLIARLKADPSDRRAVLQIWDKSDLVAMTRDPCCNQQCWFKLRNGKLHMTVTNRSNDLHFGLMAVNLPTFGILQAYIARRLGVLMGTQTHISNSLHVYTDDKRATAITDRMMKQRYVKDEEYPEHQGVWDDLEDIRCHEEFAEMCSRTLDGLVSIGKNAPDFLGFAHFFLAAYTERQPFYWDQWKMFDDWQLASSYFADAIWKRRDE